MSYCVLSGLYFFLFTFCEGREGRHQEQKIGFAVDFGELRNWFCRLGQRRLLCAISEIHCLGSLASSSSMGGSSEECLCLFQTAGPVVRYRRPPCVMSGCVHSQSDYWR
ncbi:hypothetical protein IW262DRAFT_1417912 [Armillaria fumosa]|nr:hypothetical protein IW262DRAFT_1417912 [Armillaria fumosa]